MVAPMMEVKNSGADPPAAIQVASNNLKCIQMSDVYICLYDYMQLYASSFCLLGILWAVHICHFNPFHPFFSRSRGIKCKQVAPATSGVRFHASHKRSIDPAK